MKNKLKFLTFFNDLQRYKNTEIFTIKTAIIESLYGENLIETVSGNKEYVYSYIQYYYQYVKSSCHGEFKIKVYDKSDKKIFNFYYKNIYI